MIFFGYFSFVLGLAVVAVRRLFFFLLFLGNFQYSLSVCVCVLCVCVFFILIIFMLHLAACGRLFIYAIHTDTYAFRLLCPKQEWLYIPRKLMYSSEKHLTPPLPCIASAHICVAFAGNVIKHLSLHGHGFLRTCNMRITMFVYTLYAVYAVPATGETRKSFNCEQYRLGCAQRQTANHRIIAQALMTVDGLKCFIISNLFVHRTMNTK